jgi:hypothetical protein
MDGMAEKIQSLLNDEESMRQIRELAEMFGGDKPLGGSPHEGAPPPDPCDTPPLHNLDIGKLMSLTSVLSENDPACDLIFALKPFLSREKQQKADKAVKMLRLYNMYIKMKDSGMLNDLI